VRYDSTYVENYAYCNVLIWVFSEKDQAELKLREILKAVVDFLAPNENNLLEKIWFLNIRSYRIIENILLFLFMDFILSSIDWFSVTPNIFIKEY